jgi:DNA-binding transcriptional MerR regulator
MLTAERCFFSTGKYLHQQHSLLTFHTSGLRCFKHFCYQMFQSATKRFSSNEVVALTGITPRQLQWWDERGIVVPAREGHRRVYSFDDLAEVAVLCELRRKGFSLQRVRKVMRYLQRELGKRLVETVSSSSEYHLLTDGKHIFLEDSARAVVDVLKNARQPMLTVCLSDALERVRAKIGRSREERPKVSRVRKPAQFVVRQAVTRNARVKRAS